MTRAVVTERLGGLLERLGKPQLEYSVNTARWHVRLRERFVALGPDEPLCQYLERIAVTRASRAKTWTQRLVRLLISDYDANGLLDMYAMHLFGTEQIAHLLSRPSGGRLLDIGAGSGDVTAVLKPLFHSVEVIETSWGARRRLRAKGYTCQSYDVTQRGIVGGPFDVIAMLNVLDRTDRPLTLLERVRAGMGRDTQLLLSMPLPYRPHVYSGAASREPKERLAVVGRTFSDALPRFVQQVLEPAGLQVDRLTRLPYLSAGDSDCPITVLDAAVLICRRRD